MLGHNLFRKLGGVAVTSLLVAAVATMASAVATTSPSNLVTSASKDVTAIRQYYFCETTSCKAAKSSQSAKALAGVKNLEFLLKTADSMTVTRIQESAMQNFRTDAAEMTNAIDEITSQTTSTTKTVVVGIVYFESAYLQTDLYVLGRELAGQEVKFKEWSPGVVAATQTLQIYIELETPKATTDDLIACNQGLELIAQSIEAHLNSPMPSFNTELLSMDKLLNTYSAEAIHLLKVKGTPTQKSALTAALKSFFTKFQAVTTLEDQLAT
jgi:hypothetical protein